MRLQYRILFFGDPHFLTEALVPRQLQKPPLPPGNHPIHLLVCRHVFPSSSFLPKTPLFRSTRGRTMQLTEKGLSRVDAFRIVQRRAKDAGLLGKICNHSFRATGITVYLENGGT